LYLWTANTGAWPPAGTVLPAIEWPVAGMALYVAGSAVIDIAGLALARTPARSSWPLRVALVLAILIPIGGVAAQLYGTWQTGLRPDASAYGAAVYTFIALQGFFVAVIAIMGLYTLARSLCGMLNGVRRATFENTMLMWHYTTAQGIVGIAISTFFPWLTG
ncbi:MAG: cytochrome ubiquinol oxidase subunit I, partial [Gammaproteobacteria bacterium]